MQYWNALNARKTIAMHSVLMYSFVCCIILHTHAILLFLCMTMHASHLVDNCKPTMQYMHVLQCMLAWHACACLQLT